MLRGLKFYYYYVLFFFYLTDAKQPIVKILIPYFAAGSIIGKGCQNIAQVQQSTGARIKLSPNNDYYPSTQERIGLIIGELENITAMLNFVIEKIRQEPQGLKMNPSITFDRERSKQMKFIVPNSTAGMIIGKGGVTIKSINEQTGARLQITQKDAENVAGERIIAVSGNLDQVLAACTLLVSKIQEDPEHALNNNISYAGYATTHRSITNGSFGTSGLPAALGNAAGLSAASLAGIGIPTSGSSSNAAAAANHLIAQAALLSNSGLTGSPLVNALGLQNPAALNLSSTSSSIQSTATLEITVPDELIGAVLGKGGKTINEFMQYSGARIQVSQKGEFVPGTSNRKVVITGDFTAAQIAHFLITQRIQQVEAERMLSSHQ